MFLGTPRDEGHHQWQGTSAEWSLILEQNISVLGKCCALFSRLCFRSRLHHHSKLHNFKMHNTLKWIWLLWIENTELFLIYLQRVWRQFFFIAPDFHCWHWLTERTEWKKVATPYLSGVHEAASANFFKWIIQQLEVTAIHTYPWPQNSNYWCILPLSPGLFCCRSGSFLCFIWGRKYYQAIVWKMVLKYDLGDSYIH